MRIGDALKTEREKIGLTQKEMIKGTNLKLSNYSRIENGKRKIDADDFYDLLKKRQINSIGFMKKYFGLENDVAEILTQKIIENFTSHDLAGAQKTKAEIMQLEDHQNLKYRATLIVAGLEGTINELNPELKQEIKVHFLQEIIGLRMKIR